jgi:hypothetical protein
MSKKIILGILVLTILGGVGYFVWMNNEPVPETGGETGGFSFKNFFPFGNSEEISNEIIDNQSTDNPSTSSGQAETSLPAPKLRKVSDSRVAGMVLFDISSTTYLRYIEKATGNIYEARGDVLDIRRLTNTTVPKINRAFWLPKGDGVLVQTVDENDLIETAFIKLAPTKATSTEVLVPYNTVISKLPTGIEEVSISPDGKKIIYYIKTGISDWFISNPDGTEKKNIYQNNIQNWVPQWYSANSVLLTTKASISAPSYGYLLNASNNQFSRVFGGFMGGSAKANSDGKSFLVSNADDSSMNLFLVKSEVENNLQVKTLPEKCAWDPSDVNYVVCGIPKSFPSGNYPDSWYRGQVSTNDLIERINVTDKFLYIISNPESDASEQVDVKEITVSPKGNYAAFVNKLDSSLWLLRIKE